VARNSGGERERSRGEWGRMLFSLGRRRLIGKVKRVKEKRDKLVPGGGKGSKEGGRVV